MKTITRAEIIALAKEREAQVAFATREFIREHKAEPVKSHPSFVKGWANVTFCGVETALIVGRLAKWASCFEPAEVFTVETTVEQITITAKSVNSSVKLAVRQTITKEVDAPDKAHNKGRESIGAPIVVSADFGACTVAKGRDSKAEKAELKKAKAKLPAMEAMTKLQSQSKIAVHYQEVAGGSFADALALAKCKRDALRDIRKRGVSKWNVNHELRQLGIDTESPTYAKARRQLRKWPAIKARLSAEYIAALSDWRAEYPEPVTVAYVAVAPVATTPAPVAPVFADVVAPSVRVSEKETRDSVSMALYGVPYRSLPDDSAKQDEVMRILESGETPPPAATSKAERTLTATLTFPSHEQAALFARDYTRHTLRGHTISAKVAAVHSVTLYKVGEDERQWIDSRIASEQNTPPPSVPVLETKNEHEKSAAALVAIAKASGPMSMGQAAGVYQSALPPSVAICKAETAIPEPATPPRHESPPSEEKPRQRHSRRAPRHRFQPAAWRGSYVECYSARRRVKPAPLVPVSKVKTEKVHPLYVKAAKGEHIAMKDIATLIRDALKREFPRCKFSVKSSRGSAISVRWTDGPSGKSVDAIAGAFETRGFDGSIDLAHSNSLWLYPDGSAHICHDRGTAGSMGQAPEVIESARRPGGIILGNVASCFVHTSRTVTAPAYRRAIDDFRAQNWTGCEAVEWEKISVKEGAYGVTLENVPPVRPGSGWRYLEHEICALAHSYDLAE